MGLGELGSQELASVQAVLSAGDGEVTAGATEEAEQNQQLPSGACLEMHSKYSNALEFNAF